jgi:hypothetical protein
MISATQLGQFKTTTRYVAARQFARRMLLLTQFLLALCAVLCLTSCSKPAKQPKMAMGWRRIGSWSGNGDIQTEEFETRTGQFRVKWATSNEVVPGKGRFKLIVHSSVSGRWLADDADVTGVKSGVAYHAEDPRQFYLVVESSGVDWSVSVEEGEMGEVD